MLVYLYLAVSAAVSILITVFSGMADTWRDVWVTAVLFAVLFLALVLLHLLSVAVVSLFLKKDRGKIRPDSVLRKFVLCTLEMAIVLVRAKIHVTGAEKLPDEPFVMVCNHKSLVDPVSAITVFKKHNLVFVSKKENENIPVLGKYIEKIGCLYLDRENARAAVQTINSASAMVKSGKWSVAICPEGTRNRTEELLLPFHAGSFKIAQKAKCSLVIAVFRGTENVWHNLPFKRSDIYIDIIDVLSPGRVSEMKSAELADYSRKIMADSLKESGK